MHTTTIRHLTPLILLVGLLIAGMSIPAPAVADVPLVGCVPAGGLDDRCEDWAVVHDPQVDPDQPYQQQSDVTVSPDGELVVAAGYGAQDLFETDGEAVTRWRLLGLDAEDGTQRWLATPGPQDAYSRPLDVTVAADGSVVYATGYASSGFGERDASIVSAAVDATTGDVLWESVVDADMLGQGGTDVRGWFVLPVDADRLLVAGSRAIAGTGAQSLVMMEFDADTGEVRDTITIPGTPALGTAVPKGLALSGDATTAVVGATSDGEGEFNIDFFAAGVRVDQPGALTPSWVRRYDGTGQRAPDRIEAMTADPAGAQVYVTGISSNDDDGPPFANDYDTATMALDPLTGQVEWTTRLSLGEGFMPPQGISATATKVVLAANSPAGSPVVASLDALDGGVDWVAGVPPSGPDAELARDITHAGDELVLTGSSPSSANAVTGDVAAISDTLTIGLDPADGSRRWTARHNATNTGGDGGRTVVADAAGNAYVLALVTNNVEADRNFYDFSVLAYRGQARQPAVTPGLAPTTVTASPARP